MTVDRSIPVGTRVTSKYDRSFLYGTVIDEPAFKLPGITVHWDRPYPNGDPRILHYTCGDVRAVRENEEVEFPTTGNPA